MGSVMSAGDTSAARRIRHTVFGCLAGMVLLDQAAKYLAVRELKGRAAVRIIPGILELDYVENTGMAFGMLPGRQLFLIVISLVFIFVCLLSLFRLFRQRRLWPAAACLTAILAGAVGNMLDRILRGYVIDFISFVWIHFPVFNIADCFVVVGTILLCILLLFHYSEEDFAGWTKN